MTVAITCDSMCGIISGVQSSVAKGQINNKDIRVTTGEITESKIELCVTKDDDSKEAPPSSESAAMPLSAIDPG